MKALPYEARIPNIDDHPRWRQEVALCEHCGDTGAVVAILRRHLEDFIEEYGPCPYCQQGYNLEFNTKAWGKDGYWQGREHATIQPLYPNGTTVQPPANQLQQATAYLNPQETPEHQDLF